MKIITQNMLCQIHQARVANAGAKVVRQQILDSLAEGATVESGPLTLEVRPYETQRITRADIEAILGQAALKTILARAPKTQHTTLWIDGATLWIDGATLWIDGATP